METRWRFSEEFLRVVFFNRTNSRQLFDRWSLPVRPMACCVPSTRVVRSARRSMGQKRKGSECGNCPLCRQKGTSDLSDLTSTLPLVRAGDGLQQRLEAIHVLADMRIEVAQADAARRYALRANLFLELGVRADGDDRVMEGLQDRCGRLGRGQEAVPGRVLVIDMG